MRMSGRIGRGGGWLLLTLSLVATGHGARAAEPPLPQQARGEAELLRERAQAYWTARVKDDMATAFAFEDPVRRSQLSLNDYVRALGTGVKIVFAKVWEVKIDGDLADVEVEVEARYMVPGWEKIRAGRRTLIDDWQKIDGTWVHVLDFHLFRAGKPRVTPEGIVTYLPTEAPAAAQPNK